MKIKLDDNDLAETEKSEIKKLLSRQNKNIADDLEQMWYLINLVWDDLGCDNQNLNSEKINEFYSHAIWLLNGLFIEQHKLSMQHRSSISNWVVKNNFEKVIDYGGGFGTLARLIVQKNNKTKVDIYEPYPSKFGIKKASQFNNIKVTNKLNSDYDCLLSEDVLEHVPNVLYDFSQMIKCVHIGGYLVLVNCFCPVIKCHLPQNFHFRYTFNFFAKMMGLEVIGLLKSSPATIFKKMDDKELNLSILRVFEKISKVAFPFAEITRPILAPIKRTITK